jgi:hypothetical protein
LVGSSSSRIEGSSSRRVSATRRFSPPDRLAPGCHGGQRRLPSRLRAGCRASTVDRVDLALELAHLLHQLVEVGVVLGIAHFGRDGVEAIDHVGNVAGAVLDVLEHRLQGIELRLLRQVADRDVLARPRLAGEILVEAGHDLDQR